MNFQFVLEAVDRFSATANKVAAAQHAMDVASDKRTTTALKASHQVDQALKTQTKVTEALSTATAKSGEAAIKAGDDMSRAAQVAGQAEANQAAAATRAAGQIVAAQQRISNAAKASAHAMQATPKAANWHKAGVDAGNQFSKGMTGPVIAAEHKLARAMGAVKAATARNEAHPRALGLAGDWARAGVSAGSQFAKGMATQVALAAPQMARSMAGNAWANYTGNYWQTGEGSARANGAVLAATGVTAATTALYGGYANAQQQLDLENRLRPDLGADGAKQYVTATKDYMGHTPFQRDDVYAAIPDAARSGVLPGSDTWKALMNAAAGTDGGSAANIMAAWAAMKKGDTSALAGFGINVKTGDDGKATGLSYLAGGKQQDVAVNGDIEAKVRAAIDARFAGATDRKAATIDGAVAQAINRWDAFMVKIMDNGPMDFFKDKLTEAMGAFDKGTQGADALAKTIGTNLTDALKGAFTIAGDIHGWFVSIKHALDPLVSMTGGWTAALEAAFGAMLVFKTMGVASELLALSRALGLTTAATWLFNAALWANPVTWLVGGLVALAAAAYLVYRNWGRIGPVLGAAWDGMVAAVNAAKGALGAAWDGLKNIVSEKLQGVSDAISDAWSDAGSWFDNLDFAGPVKRALDAVTAAISGWAAGVKSAMVAAFEPVVSWFTDQAKKIGGIWDSIKENLSAAANFVGIGSSSPNVDASADADRLIRSAAGASEAKDALAALSAALDAVKSKLAGMSFHAEGVALMRTLAAGIEAGAAHAVAAVNAVAQQMRDHLPHSPAKVGPLSDLDKIRFSETLAAAIRPDPAIHAVRAVAAGMAAAIPAQVAAIHVPAHVAMAAPIQTAQYEVRPPLYASGVAPGETHITYSPTIHYSGQDKQDFRALLREHAHDLAQLVNDRNKQNSRLNFREA